MNAIAKKLAKEGIDSGTHHATIRKRYAEETDGGTLDKDQLTSFRELLDAAAATQGPEKTAKVPWDLKRYLQKYPDRTHVTGIVSTSERTGRPTELEITCVDCGATRVCKAQDAFQVKRCVPCTAEYQRAKRRKPKSEKKETAPSKRKRRKKGD